MSKAVSYEWRCSTCTEYAAGPNEAVVKAIGAAHKCKAKGAKK